MIECTLRNPDSDIGKLRIFMCVFCDDTMIARFTYYVMFYVRYTECYVIKFKYFRFEKGRYRTMTVAIDG